MFFRNSAPHFELINHLDDYKFYLYRLRFLKYFYTPLAQYERLKSRQIRETIDYLRGTIGGGILLYICKLANV